MSSLEGKRILVTGAGSGIGRAAAQMFAERGAEVVLVGRRFDALEKSKETLPTALCMALDHSDEAAVAAFAAQCPELDGMFLNAGQFLNGTVESSPISIFDQMISANLRGPWLMCHHLGPRLKHGASVVFTGSNIGLRAIPDSAAYSVSKAGLHMLAKVLALEWAPRKIRCNAIAPGPIQTAMVEARHKSSQDPDQDMARLSNVNPLKRLGLEVEVAALAAHLLSDESAWTTGCVIPVDGGADAVY